MAAFDSTHRRPAVTGSQIALAVLSASDDLSVDLFLDHCLGAFCEAAACAEAQLDALAVEFFDALYGPGHGRMVWAVAGRMPDRRARLLDAIARAIRSELEELPGDQFDELRRGFSRPAPIEQLVELCERVQRTS